MAKSFGGWAFLIGVILAVVIGIIMKDAPPAWAPPVLMVIGLIVGLMNIAETEVKPFLMASAILVIVSSLSGDTFGGLAGIGPMLTGVFNGLMSLFVPATIIVAIKSVFGMAKG